MTTEHRRILVLGDTHANSGSTLDSIDYASEVGAELILQVGDWGHWPRSPHGQAFARKAEARLALRDLELWFVDGNHEDFYSLNKRPLSGDGTRWISPHVRHLPRGFRWQFSETGAVWMSLGSAVSVDAFHRRVGDSWFAEESLSDAEAAAIIADGPAVDVVLAHDAFWAPGGRVAYRLSQDLPVDERVNEWPPELILASDIQQQKLRSVCDAVQPRVWLHGHHHFQYSDLVQMEHGQVQVHGLADDHAPMAARTLLVDVNGYPVHL